MKKKLILLTLSVLMLCLNASLMAQKTNKNDLFAKIGGIKYSVISKDTLLKLDSLTISDNQFKIVSFTMSRSMKGGDIQEDKSNSNLLTPSMKQVLSHVDVGDKIWFENIKAKDPDGNERFLELIVLKVE